MANTVTVGYDGMEESRAAAEWAAREAMRRGVPLRVVYAWSWEPYSRGMDPEKERRFLDRVPREAAEHLRTLHPQLEVTAEHVPGFPPDTLVGYAEDSALMVLGSRALGALGGFLLGSVSQRVLSGTATPVVLVRATGDEARQGGTDEPGRARRPTSPRGEIVVGVDLARPSETVLDFAFETAVRNAARLRAVHVWKLHPAFGYDPEHVTREVRGDVEPRETGLLEHTLRPWRDRYAQVEVVEDAVEGNAAHHLVAASRQANLLVLGRRLHRPHLTGHIGRIVHAALHHATSPVAVVPYQ